MMSNQQGLNVTSIEELVKASQGTLVELPPFAEGTRFVARLKRPSMLAMIKGGKIPNSLLLAANELFSKSSWDVDDEKSLSNLFQIMDILCDACFVEPKYKDIKAAGVELTDDQLMFVFNYTQQGVEALRPFRQEPKGSQPDFNVQALQQDTE